MPHVRKLPGDVKENVKDMLKMKVNKKILQQSIHAKTGKYVSLKDLHNLNPPLRHRNDLVALVEEMKKEPGKIPRHK